MSKESAETSRAPGSGAPIKELNAREFLTDEVLPPPSPIPLDLPAHSGDIPEKIIPAGNVPKFTTLKGIAAPLHMANVDTDMIIPKQFLKTLKRTGLGNALFYTLRKDPHTGADTDFVLNRKPYDKALILVCDGPNFGCGSSREHAPWSLNDFGIRCVIAPSFAEIFKTNAMQNGMLPVVLPQEQCLELANDAEEQLEIEVDLEKCEVRRPNGRGSFPFEVESFKRHCLLNGLDDIGLTLQKADKIDTFEQRRSEAWPWLDGFGYKGKIDTKPIRQKKVMDW